MKIKIFIVLFSLLILAIFVWSKNSTTENFSQAKDFPVGACVYVQVADLPEFIKLWDESALKQKYLESENFADLQRRHLGIKLAERWQDLNKSIGFQFDLQTLSSLSENKAALAIYDIGKLDFVFIAPMNETVFNATMFAQNSNNFNKNELENGKIYYTIEAEFDRQRQKQKINFANTENRFVLATSEKLFLQTINAINGKQRLYDESGFKKLRERITPNLAAIWVNQEKLNLDYYFKRYWLMGDLQEIENIEAAIFDINFDEKGFTEKREILLKQAKNVGQISNQEAETLLKNMPENVPYFRLQKVDEHQLGKAIYETILDKKETEEAVQNDSKHWSYREFTDDEYKDYYNLDSDFDDEINQTDEDEKIREKPFETNQLSLALNSANPNAILTATSPQKLENSLFFEFRKVAIISLKNPNSFQSNLFENSIVEALKNQVAVANVKFYWTTEKDVRKLKIPLLGWEIGYRLKHNKLCISNNLEFLHECLENETTREIKANGISDLTIINLANREENFDDVMSELSSENDEFFTENIAGLLDVISDVKQIEIRRKMDDNFLREEICFR